MMSNTMRMAAGLLACSWVAQAAAQQYPSKPVRILHIPYKGAAPALNDVVGDRIAREVVMWKQALGAPKVDE